MIPDNVKQFTTEGEPQTYRFLEAVANPSRISSVTDWELKTLQLPIYQVL